MFSLKLQAGLYASWCHTCGRTECLVTSFLLLLLLWWRVCRCGCKGCLLRGALLLCVGLVLLVLLVHVWYMLCRKHHQAFCSAVHLQAVTQHTCGRPSTPPSNDLDIPGRAWFWCKLPCNLSIAHLKKLFGSSLNHETVSVAVTSSPRLQGSLSSLNFSLT
jgi:hypothetical protein